MTMLIFFDFFCCFLDWSQEMDMSRQKNLTWHVAGHVKRCSMCSCMFKWYTCTLTGHQPLPLGWLDTFQVDLNHSHKVGTTSCPCIRDVFSCEACFLLRSCSCFKTNMFIGPTLLSRRRQFRVLWPQNSQGKRQLTVPSMFTYHQGPPGWASWSFLAPWDMRTRDEKGHNVFLLCLLGGLVSVGVGWCPLMSVSWCVGGLVRRSRLGVFSRMSKRRNRALAALDVSSVWDAPLTSLVSFSASAQHGRGMERVKTCNSNWPSGVVLQVAATSIGLNLAMPIWRLFWSLSFHVLRLDQSNQHVGL